MKSIFFYLKNKNEIALMNEILPVYHASIFCPSTVKVKKLKFGFRLSVLATDSWWFLNHAKKKLPETTARRLIKEAVTQLKTLANEGKFSGYEGVLNLFKNP